MLVQNGLTILENNKASVRLGFDFNLIQNKQIKEMQLAAPETLQDLIPKEHDFVDIPFRALSARFLGEEGYFLDFSKEGVLEKSIPLMLTKKEGGIRRKVLKVQRNHSYRVEDTLGYIPSVEWDNSQQFSAPGINAVTRINWKLNPKDVANLLSDPPLIESASMALMFNWEQSHPELRWWEFSDFLGRELDGQIVRLIVTEITEYFHLGLVWDGGDSEAEKVENGLARAQALSGPLPVPYSNLNVPENSGNKIEKITIPKPLHKEETNMQDFIIKELSAFQDLLGLESVKDENELLSAVQGLSEAVEDLRSKNEALKTNARLGEKYLKDTREEVLRRARVVHEGELEKTREDLILNANLETLLMLDKDYRAQEAKLFPNVCQDCGSTNIKLRSSKEELDDDIKTGTVPNEEQFKTGA